MKIITGGKIITRESVLNNKALIFDKKIIDIIDNDKVDKFLSCNKNVEVINANGQYVSPGFIDLHIHGAGGHDTMDGKPSDLDIISREICKTGVTSFLPTTMTMSKEKIYRALDNIKICMGLNLPGAKVLGAHLEGPFINKKYKGAQKEDYILTPNYKFIEDYINIIRIITLAPENDENLEFIKKVTENSKIVLSIGHSNATYEEAMDAIQLGVSHITHTFNAMTPLNHRKPGVVGAAFNSDVYCELISDTVHIHPGVFNIMVKAKGKDKIILVTDSMRAGCSKEGISELGGQKVIVDESSARLEDGTLAGSILTLNKAVRNFKENTNLPIYDIVNMASFNPAKSIGIEHERGSIEIGKYSDIVIFDEQINIKNTIIEGTTVFEI